MLGRRSTGRLWKAWCIELLLYPLGLSDSILLDRGLFQSRRERGRKETRTEEEGIRARDTTSPQYSRYVYLVRRFNNWKSILSKKLLEERMESRRKGVAVVVHSVGRDERTIEAPVTVVCLMGAGPEEIELR